MNLPAMNPGGYVNASISNVTAFRGVDYLLAHGSGDDNVHYANSAHLLDMLTKEKVRGFWFRMFTDRQVHSSQSLDQLKLTCSENSDHSISRRGAYRELFEYLTEFLLEKWDKGGRRRW
jgi:dipeptidyl aminopeptidase